MKSALVPSFASPAMPATWASRLSLLLGERLSVKQPWNGISWPFPSALG